MGQRIRDLYQQYMAAKQNIEGQQLDKETKEKITIPSLTDIQEIKSVNTMLENNQKWSGLFWDESIDDHEEATISYVDHYRGFWLKTAGYYNYSVKQYVWSYDEYNNWSTYVALNYNDQFAVKPLIWLDLSKIK
mgnify:CR=1 FL=1